MTTSIILPNHKLKLMHQVAHKKVTKFKLEADPKPNNTSFRLYKSNITFVKKRKSHITTSNASF
jgi:hypothetical protein